MREPVAFKGVKNYLELTVDNDVDFDDAKQYILNKLDSGRNFFSNTNNIKILGDLTRNQQQELKFLLEKEYQIQNIDFVDLAKVQAQKTQQSQQNEEKLIAKIPTYSDVRAASKDLFKQKAQPLGSVIKAPRKREATERDLGSVSLIEPPLELISRVGSVSQSNALVVHETIRNGQRVDYDGDIVVLGDVNSGGEVVATGNIAILGFLRGTAHAGATGDETAVVAASRLEPQQLRIGIHIAIAPEKSAKQSINYPEIATVLKTGEIAINPISNPLRTKKKPSLKA